MLARELVTRSMFAAAVLSLLGGFAGGQGEGQVAAQQTGSLPRPPGVRLVTLPREPDDKPQETAVAVNPRDPRHVIVSYHRAIREGNDHSFAMPVQLHVAWSADGGQRWTVAPGTTHESYLRSLDGSVAFDLHGHASLIHIGMDSMTFVGMTTTPRSGEFVRRSLDGGRTWEASPITLIEHPATHMGPFEHLPKIVADNHAASPYAGNWYAVWDRIVDVGGKGRIRSHDMIFTRSTDDGKTWSQPRVLAKYPGRGGYAQAVVGHDGTLYVMFSLWRDHDHDREIMLAISRDGGQTFEPPRSVLSGLGNFPGVRAAPFPVWYPYVAIDPRGSPGRLFITWADRRYGDFDILAITSDDGGRTWTRPVRVNDDPRSNGKDQFQPWVAVDPTDGAAYVIFYDNRGDPKNLLATVTLARSTNGGRTFTNYAWSVTPTDPTKGPHRDYIGMAALDGRVYGAWVESAPTPPQRAAQQARPDEMAADPARSHERVPDGPSAIRIGIADFRTGVRATRREAGQR